MSGNILTGDKIKLRAIEPSDLEFMYSVENDPMLWKFGNTLIPFSRHQIEQYILSSQHDLYAEKQLRMMIDLLFSENQPKTIGMVDLYEFDPHHNRAGVGIFILPDERSKGYALEAIHLLSSYCFEILKIHLLHCSITVNNIPSIRLFEHAGFLQCGIKKEWRNIDDSWVDELMFQLIRP